jgi:hypothetical protein
MSNTLKVDTTALETYTTRYNTHLLIFDTERRHAQTKVTTIISTLSKFISDHTNSINQTQALLAKITGLCNSVKSDLVSYKADLQSAKSKLNSELKQYSVQAKLGDSERTAAAKDVSRADNNVAKYYPLIASSEKDLSSLQALIEKIQIEIKSTYAQLVRAIQIKGQLENYNSLDMAQLHVVFRGLRLVDKVKEFRVNVINGDKNAASILNTGLPDENWFQSKEALEMKNFFNDPASAEFRKAAQNKISAQGDFLYDVANPGILAAEKSATAKVYVSAVASSKPNPTMNPDTKYTSTAHGAAQETKTTPHPTMNPDTKYTSTAHGPAHETTPSAKPLDPIFKSKVEPEKLNEEPFKPIFENLSHKTTPHPTMNPDTKYTSTAHGPAQETKTTPHPTMNPDTKYTSTAHGAAQETKTTPHPTMNPDTKYTSTAHGPAHETTPSAKPLEPIIKSKVGPDKYTQNGPSRYADGSNPAEDTWQDNLPGDF